MPPGVASSLSNLKRVTGTDPGTNTECSDTVPAGKTWLLLSYSVLLVQGGANTPQPVLSIDDGTTVFFESAGSTTVQAISTSCRYTWAGGLQVSGQIGAGAAVHAVAGLPDSLYLGSGCRIRTVTANLSANTDYGAPSIYVVEYG